MRVIDGIEELKSLKGQPLGSSDWFTVEQPLIDAFADATRDRQWIVSPMNVGFTKRSLSMP